MPASSLLTLLEIWQAKLRAWAAEGAMSKAARSALSLEGNQPLLLELESALATGDFSGLPAVELLSASSIPGAAGAYAASTGKVYLNLDWLNAASEDQVSAVLTEELGHHLDALFNVTDRPGDEGTLFNEKLTRIEPNNTKRIRIVQATDSILMRRLRGKSFKAEALLSNQIKEWAELLGTSMHGYTTRMRNSLSRWSFSLNKPYKGTQHLKRKTQLSVGPNTKKLSLDFKYRIKAELSSMSASYSAEHFLNCLGIYKNGD